MTSDDFLYWLYLSIIGVLIIIAVVGTYRWIGGTFALVMR